MALSEFVAIETAYRALQPLDPAGRRRALQWLTDALDLPGLLPEDVVRPADEPTAVEAVVVETVVEPVVAVETEVAKDTIDEVEPEQVVEPEPAVVEPEAPEAAVVEPEVVEPEAKPTGSARASRKAAAAPAKRVRRPRAAKPAVEEVQDRVYRRMPPAEDVLAAYEQVGTISGLAEYFGVPRHTVQGWARRLRSAGHVIGRGA